MEYGYRRKYMYIAIAESIFTYVHVLYIPKSCNCFLNDWLIWAFVKHKRQSCNCWAPNKSEQVMVEWSRGNMEEKSIFSSASLQQNLNTTIHIFLKIHKDLDLHCPSMIFNCHATSSELIRFHGWHKFYRFLGLLNHSSMKLPSQENVNFEKSTKCIYF